MQRRSFLSFSALGMLALPNLSISSTGQKPFGELPPPISDAERQDRLAKAQRLLNENEMAALIIDAGTSMEYFTGIRWWPSERSLLIVIPAKGKPAVICPAFEEDRLREQMTLDLEVLIWQEHENPFKLVGSYLTDQGLRSGKIGMEERVRFFISDGIAKANSTYEVVSGDPVTMPCRLIKSAHEIALMQAATDITTKAILAAVSGMKEGMTNYEIGRIVRNVHEENGAEHDFALVLVGAASALPHGTRKPQVLKKGDIVLMDCGCRVHGYSSDVTRTTVFGTPSAREKEIWALEKKSQQAGFAAAQLGRPAGDVDFAARKVITDAGFGPDYKVPGLPHRTGHGIGMDGHEWGNMVKDNPLKLQEGMCFSIEPTIAIPGEFGVRLEDCVYMTAEGPRWFSKTASSLTELF
ncbi:M24 family metallopeptidase [Jiulongibacter sediminis]|uniref:Peptidase n=1 Tax=Jiulongibacter sediminis TaxID=1605367 RepID=A0A0P7BTZ1_9BACT|nr:Xaa-Pro peptidase family protein [Jiulongibacter sediminis]KPM48243.1 hypothetical protein AFM12_06170 [Jiulongibacter sediminis]TBX24785.1 hypothetical protein TK44_06175 [Jiulongibacter sediminis]